jgi:predicted nucleic acid-binding protein
VIIFDTSPLSALAEIGELDLILALYDSIVIPATVHRECTHSHTPPHLAVWLTGFAARISIVPDPVPLLAEATELDPGEAAAISLAWLHRDKSLLIIDDNDGRKLCKALGLPVTGTAGLLFAAARRGVVDFEDAFQRLQATSFRLRPAIIDELRQRL